MKRMPTKMILCILTLSLLMPNVASLGSGENISFGQEKKVEVKESDYYIKELNDLYGLNKSMQLVIYNTSKDYSLSYELLLSLYKVESNFDVKCESVSETNDVGLGQVNKFWIKPLTEVFGYKVDLTDFSTNVKASAYILSQNFKDWKKYEKIDSEKWYYLSVNSYNAGTSNINKRYVSRGKNIRTREYGQLIMDTYSEFLQGRWDYEPRD